MYNLKNMLQDSLSRKLFGDMTQSTLASVEAMAFTDMPGTTVGVNMVIGKWGGGLRRVSGGEANHMHFQTGGF